ncbi:18448_t:CDS:2, partial [Acaulospora morrowiae]
KHPSKSLLYDEYVSIRIANYLQATKFQVNPQLIKQFFENQIFPELHIDQAQTISLSTAQHGYERDDIVAFCQKFLQEIEKYEKLMPKWNDINCEVCEELYLLPDEQKHIFITYDEYREGEARVIIQFGANNDGYWDGKKLLLQLKNVITIFEWTHSGYIGVWVFDNVTSHTGMAPDALVAARMNLNPGGMQSKMRDTTWNEKIQKMTYPDDYYESFLRSQPKGIKTILIKRGL